MKYLPRILTSAATLLFAYNVYAAAETNECLPSAFVANTKFTQAYKVDNDKEPNVWLMASESFQYHDSEWNVVFGVVLPTAKAPEEALRQGQTYFGNITLSDPKKPNDWGFCEYASMDQTYVVLASTPPISFPQLNVKSLLK